MQEKLHECLLGNTTLSGRGGNTTSDSEGNIFVIGDSHARNYLIVAKGISSLSCWILDDVWTKVRICSKIHVDRYPTGRYVEKVHDVTEYISSRLNGVT